MTDTRLGGGSPSCSPLELDLSWTLCAYHPRCWIFLGTQMFRWLSAGAWRLRQSPPRSTCSSSHVRTTSLRAWPQQKWVEVATSRSGSWGVSKWQSQLSPGRGDPPGTLSSSLQDSAFLYLQTKSPSCLKSVLGRCPSTQAKVTCHGQGDTWPYIL